MLASLAVLAAAGCGPGSDDGPAKDPANDVAEGSTKLDRLATVRFTAGLTGGAHFSSVLSGSGLYQSMTGKVDWKNHVAEATVTNKEADGSVGHYTMVWNSGSLAFKSLDAGALQGNAEWKTRPLNPTGSVVERAMWTVLAIPSDRPENPVLLGSGGAMWLRKDRVEQQEVDVFRGPGQRAEGQEKLAAAAVSPEFWLDSGGQLRRFRAPIENGMFSLDFSDWGNQQIADSAQLSERAPSESPAAAPSP
ncbi:hypothetical protein [Kitasatospora albolonga]|uniref:hypothetical protein n=1 Tax=Kitasatospora albolonga TaxID=68173 RepID=UPI0031EA694D